MPSGGCARAGTREPGAIRWEQDKEAFEAERSAARGLLRLSLSRSASRGHALSLAGGPTSSSDRKSVV